MMSTNKVGVSEEIFNRYLQLVTRWSQISNDTIIVDIKQDIFAKIVRITSVLTDPLAVLREVHQDHTLLE